MSNFNIERCDQLFDAILRLKSREDCRKFFEDVCTINELQALTQRLEVAQLLKVGKNYQEISKATGEIGRAHV